MKILFDIGHPAHVHLFRSLSEELKNNGHQVYYSIREIPVAIRLMQHYGLTPFLNLGGKRDNLLGKAETVVKQEAKLWQYVRKNHIDIGISSGLVLSHVSRLTYMKSFMFDDDDDSVEPLIVKYGHPMTDVVFTPKCICRKTQQAVYYAGTHELAYLHPNRFTPDSRVLKKAGLGVNERFFIMRFVAMKGHHDVGQEGLSIEKKRYLVDLLKTHGRVIITSERAVEPEFEAYRLPVPPEDIHSLMARCALLVGDSQTMTSEAALLGVPALKCNTFAGRLSVPNELENPYGLCYAYHPKDFDKMCSRIESLLEMDPEKLRTKWREKRNRFIDEHIDVTAFFTWFIENYPESRKIMRENPNYQWRFK